MSGERSWLGLCTFALPARAGLPRFSAGEAGVPFIGVRGGGMVCRRFAPLRSSAATGACGHRAPFKKKVIVIFLTLLHLTVLSYKTNTAYAFTHTTPCASTRPCILWPGSPPTAQADGNSG